MFAEWKTVLVNVLIWVIGIAFFAGTVASTQRAAVEQIGRQVDRLSGSVDKLSDSVHSLDKRISVQETQERELERLRTRINNLESRLLP